MKKNEILWIIAAALMLGLLTTPLWVTNAAPTQPRSVGRGHAGPPVEWLRDATPVAPEYAGVVPFKSLKVGVFTYTIVWREGIFFCNHGQEALGCTEFEKQTVEIDHDQTPMQLRTTVVHEVIHAIDELHLNAGRDEEQNYEERADSAALWLGVLRDNPKFVSWLMEAEPKQ